MRFKFNDGIEVATVAVFAYGKESLDKALDEMSCGHGVVVQELESSFTTNKRKLGYTANVLRSVLRPKEAATASEVQS